MTRSAAAVPLRGRSPTHHFHAEPARLATRRLLGAPAATSLTLQRFAAGGGAGIPPRPVSHAWADRAGGDRDPPSVRHPATRLPWSRAPGGSPPSNRVGNRVLGTGRSPRHGAHRLRSHGPEDRAQRQRAVHALRKCGDRPHAKNESGACGYRKNVHEKSKIVLMVMAEHI